MTRIILHGALGVMGRNVASLASKDDDIEIVAGIDAMDGKCDFPLFKSVSQCDVPGDVVVDFSNASAIDKLLNDCVLKKLPIVLCTTALSPETLDHVRNAQKEIPILRSANMSLGINLLLDIVKNAAKVLSGSGFDIEVIEKHHRRKVDAPSGTAFALADSINEGIKEKTGNKYDYEFDRHDRSMPRPANEIGISSIRGGTLPGEHEIVFAGEDEVITLTHTAYSRNIFAKGALEAAKFLKGKPCGHYDMSEVILEK